MSIKLNPKVRAALAQADADIAEIKKGRLPKGTKIEYFPAPFTPAWIKELRRKNHMRQEDLSQCVHESLSAVRHWEQGLRRPGGAASALMRLIWMEPAIAKKLKQI